MNKLNVFNHLDNAFVILIKKFVLKAIFLQYWSCLELLRPKVLPAEYYPPDIAIIVPTFSVGWAGIIIYKRISIGIRDGYSA